ncbi:interleukin-8-like isoform X2 [Callorhinchus milii]|uniref:C-X-C motif chemokine n=1 Tax=Callorhinchus milii TaxID=7868 RepID=A0A4W3HXV7_CALMI|nr:interleukin-8-like isoform X2 [Callorhinchus milii]|eukprot:gi/632979408/ref/XP_007906452.1/ PREDICTED: interleukin-8-like isoform X2 [Callorhinchus milii]
MRCRILVVLMLLGFCAPFCKARRTSLSSYSEGKMKTYLRCRCIKTQSTFIHPKHITNVDLITNGPHCSVDEIIITLIKGNKICLDPNEKWVQMVINIIQRSQSSPGGRRPARPSVERSMTEMVKEYMEILLMDEDLIKPHYLRHPRKYGGRLFNE